MIRALFGLLLGIFVAGFVTVIVATLQGAYPMTFLFVYLPVLLILSYLNGLWPGISAAVASTAFAFLGVPRLSTATFQPLPALLFVLAALTVVVLADRYRRSNRVLGRRELHARFIADVMLEFASQSEIDVLLERIARRCTGVLGDWCGIALVEPGNPLLVMKGLHHRRADRVSRLRSVMAAHPLSKEAAFGDGGDARRPLVIAGDVLARGVINVPAYGEAFLTVGARAIMHVPIYQGREPMALLVAGLDPGRTWDEEDLRLASLIAERAGVAISNARLHEAEKWARAKAEEAANRIESLNRLMKLASSSFDLGVVFDEFATVLKPLVPFVRVTVSLYLPEKEWLTMPYFTGPRLGVGPEDLQGPKAGTARGWVVDHGRPYIRRDTMETDEFAEDRALSKAGIRSYVIVPLTVGRNTIGTLNLGHSQPRFYDDAHTELLQPIADHLALTVSRFQLFEEVNRRAGELSETLQRALLPTGLPRPPFAAIAARYRAADPESKIGGDWYDAFLIHDDSVVVSIGDVAGHGASAAAAMGQVRHVVRAYALEGASPAGILTAVNRFLHSVPDHLQMSIWLAEIDLLRGRVVYSGAGHPPVIVVAGDHLVELPSTGPPLGIIPDVGYADQHTVLAPGERLIAYTDGLTEATRNVIDGEQKLKDAARATVEIPAEQCVDLLLGQTLDGAQPHDDIAVLVLDLLPLSAPLEFSVPASPASLRRVRRAVGAYAERLGVDSRRVEDIKAAVGEASLNVVEHAYGGGFGGLSVRAGQVGKKLVVAIADTGQWRTPIERGRGRGIAIMRGLADGFRTYTGPAGTVVELTWNLRPHETPVRTTSSVT